MFADRQGTVTRSSDAQSGTLRSGHGRFPRHFEPLESRQMLTQVVADFALVNVNESSATYDQPVSPRDFVGQVEWASWSILSPSLAEAAATGSGKKRESIQRWCDLARVTR